MSIITSIVLSMNINILFLVLASKGRRTLCERRVMNLLIMTASSNDQREQDVQASAARGTGRASKRFASPDRRYIHENSDIQMSDTHGWLSKLWSLFGSLL